MLETLDRPRVTVNSLVAANIALAQLSLRQYWPALGFGVALTALALLTIPVEHVQWPEVSGIVPAIVALAAFADLITAALLLNQFLVVRKLSFAVLAAGYAFTGLMICVYFLTFPGFVVPSGLFGGDLQTGPWTFVLWHDGFFVVLIAYSLTAMRYAQPLPPRAVSRTILILMVAVVAAVAALTWGTVAIKELPALLTAQTPPRFTPFLMNAVLPFSAVLGLIAVVLTIRVPRKNTIELWICISALATLLDMILSTTSGARFSIGWYMSRFYALTAAFTVLLVFLREIYSLCSRLTSQSAAFEQLAYLDGLTGVPNKRALLERLAAEWERARRYQRSIALLMLDVDHFKQYNDTFGHMQGDTCLQKVAAGLSGAITRASDFLARYGGEEFVVLMPETEIEGATALAERVRSAVASVRLAHPDPDAPIVTVSVGVASAVPRSGEGWQVLLEAADAALYQAKDQGRNRVIAGKPEFGLEKLGRP
ncbi:MAG TPA: sensor domain-containing diguanylate cyclase [Candidatus Binatia bacterium]|nr:sensor domain-containing diguanylate cyclase [Candidatus Binatia bacterium]